MRPLGIPTVADRIAQEVARRYLEPYLEAVFHTDSYGYRPGRSAIDAVRQARQRCWRYDWVLDIDVKAYFDSIDWERFRGVKLGRKPKLTDHQKREAIRRRDRDGEPVREIARSYNVSHSTISRLA